MIPGLNKVQHGSCLDLMKEVPDKSVDLVFADPPFNIGYEYDVHKDKMSPEQYKHFCLGWVYHCRRVLRPGGSIFVAIGDEYAAQIKRLLDKHFQWRNWIIWKYNFGQNCRTKFNRCHVHILYHTKGEVGVTFNADAVKVPSARQEIYNDKRAKDGGKVPDDVWEFPRLPGNAKERTGHPCQMPLVILERIVKVASNPGDMVLDPFCGSGTTAVAAKKLRRNYWTCDVSSGYVTAARHRLEKIQPGLAD